jgi:hypothetical protein
MKVVDKDNGENFVKGVDKHSTCYRQKRNVNMRRPLDLVKIGGNY